MRILFFGRYDPAYSRNRVLLKGLRANGADVAECRVAPHIHFWLFRLLWQYIRMRPKYDVLFVAFPGQEVMLLARWLTRKPIIFDAFASHYEGYVQDRKKVRPGSVRARWYHWLDWAACRLASAVLTDTAAHAQFFSAEFGIEHQKLHPIFVGTDTALFSLAGPDPTGPFTVHFHGTNIPLQGIPTILQAKELLKDERIIFNLIGVHAGRVSYESLASHMAAAHVCLGIFGDTPKTPRVIPNKVYEALAVGRPIITADTPAMRELLDDRSAFLIPAADARALADAILKLRDNPELRHRLGHTGYAVFLARATPVILGAQVIRICTTLHGTLR